MYCSPECRNTAQKKAHRESQRKYRKTEKGKKAHRLGEKRRRMGLSKKNKKTVDDEGSILYEGPIIMELTTILSNQEELNYAGTELVKVGCCNFCGCTGVIVDSFPRRGYRKREYTKEMLLNCIINGEIGIKNNKTNRDLRI